MKLKFVKAGATMSDETTPYNVVFDKECTVREMIEAILKENPTEYGTIYLRNKDYEDEGRHEFYGGCPHCDYRRGKISNVNIPEQYMNASVDKVDSCGGWGVMSYWIYIK